MAGANLAMFAGGIGMYLLLTLVTRYVQTPAGTGYGFGFAVFVAGLVLVPFSALGFVGGRLAPALRRHRRAGRSPAAGEPGRGRGRPAGAKSVRALDAAS